METKNIVKKVICKAKDEFESVTSLNKKEEKLNALLEKIIKTLKQYGPMSIEDLSTKLNISLRDMRAHLFMLVTNIGSVRKNGNKYSAL